jgi:hypothetical protein
MPNQNIPDNVPPDNSVLPRHVPPHPERSGLFPEHLADLQKSGLSLETIQALHLYSVKPADLQTLIGWVPAVESALVFPYPGEGDFCRVKLFPPYKDEHGHTIRYLQRKDSGVRFYVPPQALQVLQDPTRAVAWTEGEKKAAKACQDELLCVALGGLWNWRETGEPIPRLDHIAHIDREEFLYPDSDVWQRPDLLKAVYAFGKELEQRGAQVRVVIIPRAANGEKRGLDDFLVQAGRHALAQLKQVPLKHRAFSQTADWWKTWKAKEKAKGQPSKAHSRLAEQLAEALGSTLAFDLQRQRWMRYGARLPGIWGELREPEITDKLRQDLSYYVPGGFAWSTLQGVERLLRGLLRREFVGPSRTCLPFCNGALHVPTMQLEPHTPERGFTWCLPYNYAPHATGQPILDWLAEVQDGHVDRARVLLAYLKAVLIGRNDFERFLEAIGPGGTGKSTFERLAMALVGQANVHVTDLQQLETNRFETSNILGKRLVIISDADRYGGPINVLKALTGRDPLRNERKYDPDAPHFKPQAMVIIGANEAIQSTDYTSGLERRRLTIPFRHRPQKVRQLLDFDEQGVAVGEFAPYLPGLINAVLAIPDAEMEHLIRRTLQAVPSLQEAWRQALIETNPLAAWANEYLTADKGATCYVGCAEWDASAGRFKRCDDWLYPSYRQYAEGAGEPRPVSMQRFRRLLLDLCQHQLKLPGIESPPRDRDGQPLIGLHLRRTDQLAMGPGLMAQALTLQAVPCEPSRQVPDPMNSSPTRSAHDGVDEEMTAQPLDRVGFDGVDGSSQHPLKTISREPRPQRGGESRDRSPSEREIGEYPSTPSKPTLPRVGGEAAASEPSHTGGTPVSTLTSLSGHGLQPCYSCRGRRFWLKAGGGYVCERCHPPVSPDVVRGVLELTDP